jgi:hypothetical protein
MVFRSGRMDREIREARSFSEDVDRLLAGEESAANEDKGEEYRSLFSFARRVADLRRQPSPRFKADLKRELLLKLEEQEVQKEERAKIGLWRITSSFVPRSAAWRTATVTVMVGVLAVLILWGAGMFGQAPTTLTGPEGSRVLSVSYSGVVQLEAMPPDSMVRSVGENFEVGIIFKNVSNDYITIDPYPPAIEIQQADTGDVVRYFEQGSDKREIAPSEGLIYPLVWDQRDDSGQSVGAGKYIILVENVALVKDSMSGNAFTEPVPVVELEIQ